MKCVVLGINCIAMSSVVMVIQLSPEVTSSLNHFRKCFIGERLEMSSHIRLHLNYYFIGCTSDLQIKTVI